MQTIDKRLDELRKRKSVAKIGIRELDYEIKKLLDLKVTFERHASIRLLTIHLQDGTCPFLRFNNTSACYAFKDIEQDLMGVLSNCTGLKTVKLHCTVSSTLSMLSTVAAITARMPSNTVERLHILFESARVRIDLRQVTAKIKQMQAGSLSKVIIHTRRNEIEGICLFSLEGLIAGLLGCRNIKCLQIGTSFNAKSSPFLTVSSSSPSVCRVLSELIRDNSCLQEVYLYNTGRLVLNRLIFNSLASEKGLTDVALNLKGVQEQSCQEIELLSQMIKRCKGIEQLHLSGLSSSFPLQECFGVGVRCLRIDISNSCDLPGIEAFAVGWKGGLDCDRFFVEGGRPTNVEFNEQEYLDQGGIQLIQWIKRDFSHFEFEIPFLSKGHFDYLRKNLKAFSVVAKRRNTISIIRTRLEVDDNDNCNVECCELDTTCKTLSRVTVYLQRILKMPTELVLRTLHLILPVDRLRRQQIESSVYCQGLVRAIESFYLESGPSDEAQIQKRQERRMHKKSGRFPSLSFYSCLKIGQYLRNSQR